MASFIKIAHQRTGVGAGGARLSDYLAKNSVDLLKFIEHNPRICGVILTGMSTVSIYAAISINLMNIPALCLHQHPLDDGCQRAGYGMALWFFEYALGQAEDIAIRCVSTPTNILITLHRRSRKPCYLRQRAEVHLLYAGAYGRHPYQKSPVGCLFYDFFGGNTLRLMSLFRSPSLVRCSTTPGQPGSGRVHRADFWRGTELYRSNGTSTSNKIVGMYAAPSGSRC